MTKEKDGIEIFFKKSSTELEKIDALKVDHSGTVEEFVFTKINFIASLILSVMATLAVAAIIYAGFLYIFSVGNEDLRAKASRTVIYVISAIVVSSIAYGLTNLVIELANKFLT